MSYKLKLDVFEGPLDLLLYLIKKNDIDICDIPIAQITDQYMEYIQLMKMLDLDVVGEFLVMAATLLQIKSRMLLPRNEEEEEEEGDPREELVQRLEEYKMFKEVAAQLKEKEKQKQDLYPRKIDEVKQREIKNDAKEVFLEANLFDLINAFTKALRKFKEEKTYEITSEEFTVEQKIHDILHTLMAKESVLLNDFFSEANTKPEVIVTFMAILELIRLKEIKVMQKRLFSDIEVVRNRENMISNQEFAQEEAQRIVQEKSENSFAEAEEPKEEEIAEDVSLTEEVEPEVNTDETIIKDDE